ncbi:hypothetical protein [Alicyclobacillus fodiniaquatilis]|uniref:Uncharacterized protein n=1 Tax=Alicyclobacillus fodiniaquatilis TaxID=1661150 RepID=A0ABW4JH27_9BACL
MKEQDDEFLRRHGISSAELNREIRDFQASLYHIPNTEMDKFREDAANFNERVRKMAIKRLKLKYGEK